MLVDDSVSLVWERAAARRERRWRENNKKRERGGQARLFCSLFFLYVHLPVRPAETGGTAAKHTRSPLYRTAMTLPSWPSRLPRSEVGSGAGLGPAAAATAAMASAGAREEERKAGRAGQRVVDAAVWGGARAGDADWKNGG